MGYMHVQNLYKARDILMFKECFVMEKVHGTSAHISWNEGKLGFFSGGEKYENFVKLFNHDELAAKLTTWFENGLPQKMTIYGEAYGGRCQGMSATYGKDLRFIAFEVKINDNWLSVDKAHKIVTDLGLEFVPFEIVPTDITILDRLRDKPSEVALRRGCGVRPREGIVIRPLIELTKNNGERIIVKHKGDAFKETASPRAMTDPAKLKILEEADAIAEEWVTEMRLNHILQNFPSELDMGMTSSVIKAMVDDIEREAEGEIVMSKDAARTIGTKTVQMFKRRINAQFQSNLNQPQTPTTGINAVVGKWPGNETDEEIKKALEDLS